MAISHFHRLHNEDVFEFEFEYHNQNQHHQLPLYTKFEFGMLLYYQDIGNFMFSFCSNGCLSVYGNFNTIFEIIIINYLHSMFHVTWTTFKFNRNQLRTVSAYVMSSVPWSNQRAHEVINEKLLSKEFHCVTKDHKLDRIRRLLSLQ